MQYTEQQNASLIKKSIIKLLDTYNNSEDFAVKKEKQKKIHKKDIRKYSNILGKYLMDFRKSFKTINSISISEQESLDNLNALSECIEKLMKNDAGALIVANKLAIAFKDIAKEYRSKSV